MTPLAQELANILVSPKRDRVGFWAQNQRSVRTMLEDTHYFEMTGVLPIMKQFSAAWKKADQDSLNQLLFLPAPKTWLEWKHPNFGRMALHLYDVGDWAEVHVVFAECAAHIGRISLTSDDFERYKMDHCVPVLVKEYHRHEPQFFFHLLAICHIFLCLINTPKIIGRRQFMPHRGLEKRLTKAFGVGKFPLRAWTEIQLKIAKPIEIDDGEPHEAHLTGRRALHFCRAHLRIRNGQVEYVSSHWRGDPALGIKQSRYAVSL